MGEYPALSEEDIAMIASQRLEAVRPARVECFDVEQLGR